MRKHVRYLVGALVLLYVLAEPAHAAHLVTTGFYLLGDAMKSLFIFVTALGR